MSEIGNTTFGVVVGMAGFKRDLKEAERHGRQAGEDIGEGVSDGATDGVEKGSGAFSTALKGMAVAGAGLFAASFADGLQQEAMGDRLGAQLGLNEAQSRRAGDVAGKVYADAYGQNLEQVHTAVSAVMGGLGRFGVEGEAALERVSKKALNLSDVFDIDVQRAVASAGTLINSGLVADADQAFDLIVASLQRVPAHLREDVLDASDEYAKFFADLGINGTQAFGMLVAASADGMYGIDKTGDALKEFGILATDMSTRTGDAYAVLGMNQTDMTNRLLAGGATAKGAFDEIVAGLLAVEDPAARSQASLALFGTPLEDLSVTDIPKFLSGLQSMNTDLGRVEGSADRMGERLASNTQSQVTQFGREVRQLGVDLQGKLITNLNKLPGPLQKVAVGFAAVGGGAVSLLGDLGPGVLLLPKLGTAMGGLATGVKAVGAAFMTASPWILAFAAAIMIGYLIYQHWDEIVAFFGQVWETVKGIFSSALEAVKGFVSSALDWLKSNWDIVLAVLTGPVGLAVLVIRRFGGDIVDFFSGLPGKIVSALGDLGSLLWGAGKALLDGMIGGAKAGWNAFVGFWNGIEIRVPGVKIPLAPDIPGFTLGVPDLPYLAAGGITLTSGAVVVGEAGPELLDLPRGARVTPLDRVGVGGGGLGMPAASDTRPLIVNVDGQKLFTIMRDRQTDWARRGGRGRTVGASR